MDSEFWSYNIHTMSWKRSALTFQDKILVSLKGHNKLDIDEFWINEYTKNLISYFSEEQDLDFLFQKIDQLKSDLKDFSLLRLLDVLWEEKKISSSKKEQIFDQVSALSLNADTLVENRWKWNKILLKVESNKEKLTSIITKLHQTEKEDYSYILWVFLDFLIENNNQSLYSKITIQCLREWDDNQKYYYISTKRIEQITGLEHHYIDAILKSVVEDKGVSSVASFFRLSDSLWEWNKVELFFTKLTESKYYNREILKSFFKKFTEREYQIDDASYDRHYVFHNGFLAWLSYFLAKKNINILSLISFKESRQNIMRSYDSYLQKIVANIIKPKEVSYLINKLQIEHPASNFDFFVFNFIEQGTRKNKATLLNTFKKLIPKKINEINWARLKVAKEEEKRKKNEASKAKKEIELAIKEMEDKPDNVSPKLFYLFENDLKKDKVERYFNVKQRKVVKYTAERFLGWHLFDYSRKDIVSDISRDGSARRANTDWYISDGTFFRVVNFIKELGINETPYRKKIISSLPFAYPDDQDAIKQLFPSLEAQEVIQLISLFTTPREDDFQEWCVYNYLGAIITYKDDFLKEEKYLNESLKFIIWNPDFADHERETAINLVNQFKIKDVDYLKDFFNKNVSTLNFFTDVLGRDGDNNKGFLLARTANTSLIKLGDQDAIKWRLDQIKNGFREYKLHDYSGKFASLIAPEDSEITFNQHFIEPLLEVESHEVVNNLPSLLEKSFENLKKNENKDFSNYVIKFALRYLQKYIHILNPHQIEEISDVIENHEYAPYNIEIKEIFLELWVKLPEEVLTQTIKDSQVKKNIFESNLDKEKSVVKVDGREVYIEKLENKCNEYEKIIQKYQNVIPLMPEYLLMVEGIDDKKHLINAYHYLYDADPQDLFYIFYRGGCSWIRTHLLESKDLKSLLIWVFDFDPPWLKEFNSVVHPTDFPIIGKDPRVWVYCKHKDNHVYGMLLPVSDNMVWQVMTPPWSAIAIAWSKNPPKQKNASDEEYLYWQPQMRIENLFYERIANDENRYFISRSAHGGGSYIHFHERICSKSNFPEEVRKIAEKEKNDTGGKTDIYENFRKLFVTLHSLIDDYKKNTQTTQVSD